MKKAVAMLSIAAWAGVVAAGTCTYSFAWFKNSAVTDFQVPRS